MRSFLFQQVAGPTSYPSSPLPRFPLLPPVPPNRPKSQEVLRRYSLATYLPSYCSNLLWFLLDSGPYFLMLPPLSDDEPSITAFLFPFTLLLSDTFSCLLCVANQYFLLLDLISRSFSSSPSLVKTLYSFAYSTSLSLSSSFSLFH